MDEYGGTRIAVGELPRVTQQVAISMALALGHQSNIQSFRRWATKIMFGVLRGVRLDIQRIELDYVGQTEPEEKQKFESWSRRESSPYPVDTKVDVVLTPIDGANALREGRSGALSVIAAGRPGCFVGSEFADKVPVAPSFLLLAISGEAWTPAMRKRLQPFHRNSKPIVCDKNQDIDAFLTGYRPVDSVIDALKKGGQEPIIGLNFESANCRGWTPSIKGPYMGRRLEGSAFSACLGAFLNKVSATICVARRTHVKQIAVAARATGGRMWAIPLHEERAKKPNFKNVKVKEGSKVRHEDDFVGDTNVVCVCSSISEVCVQDRVRFMNQHRVSVHTLILSNASGGLRTHVQLFDLKRAPFRGYDGNVVGASMFLGDFKKELEAKPPRKRRTPDL